MPRTARLIEDNGYYHILTRGNDRKSIFRYPQDYAYFLKIAEEILKKHPISVYHYCLMGNHIHLLVKACKAKDLPKFFQILLQRYAHYFRKRYKATGYLFQNRYKSYHIDKEGYLLDCARYIERNPVRANMVSSPDNYKWSSYLYYAQGRQDAIIKEPSSLYLELGETTQVRQDRYKNYLLEDRPYEHIVDKGLMV
jgi:putative transposase